MFTTKLNFDESSGLSVHRNTDWTTTLTITNADGSPFNLTGYSAKMTIAPFIGSPTNLITLQSSDTTWQGIHIPSPTSGGVLVTIAQATLAALPAPPVAGGVLSCVYDIILTDPGGHTSAWFEGTFEVSTGVSGTGSSGGGGGGGAPAPYYLNASGSVPNLATTGTFGSISTNLSGSTKAMSSRAGLGVEISGDGNAFVPGVRPIDIMYRRLVSFNFSAQTLPSGSDPGVTLLVHVTMPVVDVGSATLTATPSTTTPSVVEFNAQKTTVVDLTISTSAAGLRGQVITDNSPFEVITLNATTLRVRLIGWVDHIATPTLTARVRFCDATNSYGYYDVTVAVTAFDWSMLPTPIVIDPANAVPSSGTITGLTAKQGATNYAMVVPSGNTPPTRGTVTGADGLTKPTLVFSDSTQVGLACGPNYSGTTSALGALFDSGGAHVQAPSCTIMGVFGFANGEASRSLVSFGDDTGGWTPSKLQGVLLGTGSNGAGYGTKYGHMGCDLSTVTGGSYVAGSPNPTVGTITLTTSVPHHLYPGNTVYVQGATGTGAYTDANGAFTLIAGTVGTTVNGDAGLTLKYHRHQDVDGSGHPKWLLDGSGNQVLDSNGNPIPLYPTDALTVTSAQIGTYVANPIHPELIYNNAFQVLTLICDGYQAVIETNVPRWDAYPTQIAPDSNAALTLPATNTFTSNTLRLGGGFYPGQPWTLGILKVWTTPLTQLQRQQANALLAREWTTAQVFVPPQRVTTNGLVPTYNPDFSKFIENRDWGWEMSAYSSVAFASLNNETSIYPNFAYSNIRAIFPEKVACWDPSTQSLKVFLRKLNAAQKAYIAATPANVSRPVADYNWWGGGIRTHQGFAQHMGFFEVRVKGVRGRAIWYCWWVFTSMGGNFELDGGEAAGQQPTVTSGTHHMDEGGAIGHTVYTDDQTLNFQDMAWKWWDNFDGTHSMQFYLNREPIAPPIVRSAANCMRACALMLDITMGWNGTEPDEYTYANAPYAYECKSFAAYADPSSDLGQPPLRITDPTISRSGTVLTATPGLWDWSGTKTQQWYTVNPAGGEDAIAGATGLTLDTSASAYSTVDFTRVVMWKETNQNAYWPVAISARGYIDPAVTPAISLSSLVFPAGAAAGTVLAYFQYPAHGAAMSITSSDTSNHFTVSVDSTSLLAGSSYAALTSGTYTVYTTETPAFGGPVKNQTFSVTVGSGGGGGGSGSWGGTWATGSSFTLTNSNLTAEHTAAPADQSVVGTTTQAISGTLDVQFTVTINVLGSGNTAIGLVDGSYTLNNGPGGDSHSVAVYHDGQIYYNGFTTGANMGTLSGGASITIRNKNGVVYFSKDGGTNWYGTTSAANPTAGTGGIALSFMASAVKPVAFAAGQNTKFTGAF